MKNKFLGYYPPTNIEVNTAWESGLISIDANALLNLYRYTDSTKLNFIQILDQLKDRIWIPYQAAFEFHDNRLNVINTQKNAYQEIQKLIDQNVEKLTIDINKFTRHPILCINEIVKAISDSLSPIKKTIDDLCSNHPNYDSDDSILSSIGEILNNRVGEKLSYEELEGIYKEGKVRYENRIPPGFCDKNNKEKISNQSLYGDLIIWKELIKHIIAERKPLIFVTDDRKEDWWKKFKGKTIGPREELIQEFFENTNVRILIYQADQFLKFALEKLSLEVKNETVTEVHNARVSDEKIYVSIYNYLQKRNALIQNDSLAFNPNTSTYLNSINPQNSFSNYTSPNPFRTKRTFRSLNPLYPNSMSTLVSPSVDFDKSKLIFHDGDSVREWDNICLNNIQQEVKPSNIDLSSNEIHGAFSSIQNVDHHLIFENINEDIIPPSDLENTNLNPNLDEKN
jgi:hypothetical protein